MFREEFIESVKSDIELLKGICTEWFERDKSGIKCPVIEYMHSLGQEPSAYFVEETLTLYDEVAKQCGFNFELEYYNADGGAKFVFCKWRKNASYL